MGAISGPSSHSLLSVGAVRVPAVPTYAPRDPSHTVLSTVRAEPLEPCRAACPAAPEAIGLPADGQRAWDDSWRCGLLASGVLRLGGDTWQHALLGPCRCQRRGLCPACAGRHRAQRAAHLVERVLPWGPTRPWVVSVPLPLRSWMAGSQDRTATGHTRMRTTSGPYDVKQAVTRGLAWAPVPSGSGTWLPRLGSALQVHLHVHGLFLERACRVLLPYLTYTSSSGRQAMLGLTACAPHLAWRRAILEIIHGVAHELT
jgi:hypothetical protein